jgi:hypothetical protein
MDSGFMDEQLAVGDQHLDGNGQIITQASSSGSGAQVGRVAVGAPAGVVEGA